MLNKNIIKKYILIYFFLILYIYIYMTSRRNIDMMQEIKDLINLSFMSGEIYYSIADVLELYIKQGLINDNDKIATKTPVLFEKFKKLENLYIKNVYDVVNRLDDNDNGIEGDHLTIKSYKLIESIAKIFKEVEDLLNEYDRNIGLFMLYTKLQLFRTEQYYYVLMIRCRHDNVPNGETSQKFKDALNKYKHVINTGGKIYTEINDLNVFEIVEPYVLKINYLTHAPASEASAPASEAGRLREPHRRSPSLNETGVKYLKYKKKYLNLKNKLKLK